nr:MAG TPA: hypothetical protein [Caudoviricetes sp.]
MNSEAIAEVGACMSQGAGRSSAVCGASYQADLRQ